LVQNIDGVAVGKNAGDVDTNPVARRGGDVAAIDDVDGIVRGLG
jgi:hypothetical protein